MHRGFKKGCGINSNILTSPSLADGKGLPPSSASPPPSPPLSRSSLAPGDQEEEQEGVACSSITILHFNDVYNIEGREKEPVGGAARFKTCLDRFWHLDPLTFFSGDALAPSNISVVMKGEQMVEVLNTLNIQCAVYGNHDFDFGIERLVELAGRMNFPWLMSNVRCAKTKQPLAEGKEYHIIQKGGRKIGLIGLVEMEWIATLASLQPEDIIYTDFVESAKSYVPLLQQEGCDLIIALTHMRVPNDLKLAREVPELHMVLGGHDHHYEKKMVGPVLVLKSGSEFREFSQLTVTFPSDEWGSRPSSSSSNSSYSSTCSTSMRPQIKVVRHEVTKKVEPDSKMEEIVQRYLTKVKEGLEREVGTVKCCMEGRFKYVRTRETNLGNLVADIMRKHMKADVALLNSGTLRSDCLHEAGLYKMKDLRSILPIVDSIVMLELTGLQLLKALENGVSQYPKHEGRFPQVSGVKFAFDPTQPCGSRVVADSVYVHREKLEESKLYRLCTKGYIGQHGKDGYDVFRDCRVLVPEDEGPILFTIVCDYFMAAAGLGDEDVDGDRSVMEINPKVEGRIVILNPHSESSGSE